MQEKKILVLVDGSERAMKTVQYVGKFLPPSGFQVVLFHIFDPVPECYWDLEKEPQSISAVGQLRSWELQKKKNIEAFMESAKDLLAGCGFAKTSVTVNIQNRKQGIARDIIKEAEEGAYSMVVLRRRGWSALESLVMGSVANKILARIKSVPLVIAGQIPPVKKILLAVDGSDSSYRVVDVVGTYLGGFDYEMLLYHVIRGFGPLVPEIPDAMISSDRVELAKSEIRDLFAKLRHNLIASGVAPEKISEKIATGEFSRAGAIIREATQGGYGAIAMGRRGISKVEEFFLGRVSNKVIHGGRNHTVWVV